MACVAAILGSIYGALATIAFMWGSYSMDLAPVAFGGLTVVSLPVMLVFCATGGWWLMHFIGSRVRVNRLLVFAMAGMVGGLLLDAAGVAIFTMSYGVGWLRYLRGPYILMFAWGMSLAPCYLMLAVILGGMRWKQLEDRNIV
jgi:hypothetical protein